MEVRESEDAFTRSPRRPAPNRLLVFDLLNLSHKGHKGFLSLEALLGFIFR